ncbi:carbohydrate ABC transporter permease [Streptomyces sp. HNM0663]|uniref:Carbohydrate ABC transporter permease n=1 Tax=Streptomyces chengmaiensis TaxID=3040919 RepID=A0ABT6HYL4_9ACTN|nr:carbohydrate ABC transporter permease [Streptomyces chengmaiensis]MDH2393802.1 carbohydrate ABC transporter permease [Streptomyces chengmaiensis]
MTMMLDRETLPGETPRREHTRRRPTLSISPLSALRIMILFGFAVFCLVPLIWLVLAPTNTDAQLLDGSPLSFGSFDRMVEAWRHLTDYNDGVMYNWMLNSVYYTVVSLVISVVVALLAGYALATMRFPGRKLILLVTLLAMVLPPAAVVLPLFLEINAVQLTNTAASVILPAAFYPFGVYLAFIYFATSLPKELLEAARIDGCSEVRLFLSIAVPVAKPLIALVAFFSFIANWNNYFLPYVMLSEDSKYNLPVGLGALMASTPALRPQGGTTIPITYPEAAMAGLIVVAPVAVLFLLFQRFLVRGILAGSTKG